MKKIFVWILGLLLLLSGCAKAEAPGQTSLDLWVTSRSRGEIYEALAEAWNAEHPEEPIQLNISVYSSQSIAGKFSRGYSVSTSYSGSSIPDLVELDYTAFPEFVFQQTADIYPLQNLLQKHESDVPGAKLYSKNGICFALPYRGQELLLCYRLDLEQTLGNFRRKAASFEGLLELGSAYAEAAGEPLLWVDYLGSEVFLALFCQAMEQTEDAEEAYDRAVSLLTRAHGEGAWGMLPSGDAYSDNFRQLLTQKQIPCFVTTRANLQQLAEEEETIPQNYGVLALPSFGGQGCRVDAPTVAVAVHMSGGDTVSARNFLEYCRFSEAARAWPEFYLGPDAPELPELSERYQVNGTEKPAGTGETLTALELEAYLSSYSRQVLGAGLS